MSQITRCPSCATSFKVVADQLRISEGWVRCGQCKEVFDASEHLLPVVSEALLPDVSLTDVRPPLAPVARKAEVVRAWGGGTAAMPAADARPIGDMPAAPGATDSHPKETAPPEAPAAMPVLDIPNPAVPAFLAASGATAASGEDMLSLAPSTPFAWRAPPSPWPRAADPAKESLPPLHGADSAAAAPEAVPPVVPQPAPAPGVGVGPAALPGGYELPSADLRDSEWPAEIAAEPLGAVAEAGDTYPALETPAPAPASAPPSSVEHGAPLPPAALAEQVPEALPSVDFVQQPAQEAPAALALEADDSATALQVGPRPSSRSTAAPDAPVPPEKAAQDADPEIGFVVAARRKAFWRKPAVRAVLVLVALLSILGLALQVAVQERDRIVALDARARPWLMMLCEPLRCEIAPQRQIADVVIDSSSFNKARGDSYQLALTMKNQAAIPLAMPAVELTLTDAQDQPVLRRVLLPADMAAPAELPPRGEWSTTVSVIVTTGGARVAGYRLLAFYP